jgi:hypothetical protein
VGVRRVLVGKAAQLLFGALLGLIAAAIITGDERYVVIIAVGVPVIFTVLVIVGMARSAKKRRGFTQPARAGGINATVVGPAAPAKPVLNPSAGVVLNGERIGGASPEPAPASGRRPFWWRALSIVTILAGAAVALIPSYGLIGWIASDVVAGRPFDGRDMRFGLHQQEAFDQVADVMGDTQVTSVHFYDSYISVSAPTTPGAKTIDRYEWRYGHAHRLGADYSQPQDIREELFDAGGMDMAVVGRVVRDSLDDADLEGVDGIYPSIRRFAGEEPQINVTISSTYYDASYTYTLEGELIQRSGSAFD